MATGGKLYAIVANSSATRRSRCLSKSFNGPYCFCPSFVRIIFAYRRKPKGPPMDFILSTKRNVDWQASHQTCGPLMFPFCGLYDREQFAHTTRLAL